MNDTPLGKDAWKCAYRFFWILSHAPFPFVEYNLYCLIVINPLNPVSPSGELSSMKVVLGTPYIVGQSDPGIIRSLAA